MVSVIHVDNSRFFRKVMKIFLAELGMDCESYECGEDVLDAVETHKVSCIITGLELSDMSGEDLIRRLLFTSHPMTIIAVTASGDEDRVKRLEDLGVMATIQKGGDWKEKLREYL
jgi:FixJ family two-component response regulator